MPKINVYLPDELAEAVKQAGVPVSAICQRALEQSVRRITAIRETALNDLPGGDPTSGLSRFTERARTAIKLGIERARAGGAPNVGTEHLLDGLLTEGGNLALHVLRAVDIEPDQLAQELTQGWPPAAEHTGHALAGRFSVPAAGALELAVTEAISLGHNYVGCEHLLLGLIAEPDGTAGQALRTHGAELRVTRRAVVAALAGYVHLRAEGAGNAAAAAPTDGAKAVAAMVRQELRPLIQRLERLEGQAGLAGEN